MNRLDIESAFADALPVSGIVSAYLFGSVAENRDHRESDIDVGVLLDRATYPGARERFEQRLRLSSVLSSAVGGRTVDIVILNDAPATFARHIVIRGRRFFCADGERDRCFVRCGSRAQPGAGLEVSP
jgi:predicted nucleotidyltransferase